MTSDKKTTKRTTERAQNKVRRILMLIDALASLRMPFTLQEATYRLAERTNSTVDVCPKTIRRDMELLVSMEFAYVYRKAVSGTGIPTQYRMNLRSATLADVAANNLRTQEFICDRCSLRQDAKPVGDPQF